MREPTRSAYSNFIFLRLFFVAAQLALTAYGQPDAALCVVTGIANTVSDVTNTIRVQAVEADGSLNGNPMSTGGYIFTLQVEQLCTMLNEYYCSPSAAQDNVAGLPLSITMTDNGDGTYDGSYSVTATSGTVTVSVDLVDSEGIVAMYWKNMALTGDPAITREEPNIDFSWGGGSPPDLNQNDGFGARFTGYIVSATTTSYTVYATADDSANVLFQGQSKLINQSMSVTLQAGAYNPFVMTFAEGGGGANTYLYWNPNNTGNVVIPASAFFHGSKVKSTTYEVEIFPTSVPAVSEVVNGLPSIFIEDTYTVTMQSKNMAGVAHDVDSDTYLVVFSDGASQTFTETAIHQGSGLYSASFTPTLIGTYTVTINLTNDYTATDPSIQTQISGSGYTVTVYPAPVSPANSYMSSGLDDGKAEIQKTITVQLVDRNGDLKTDGLDQVTLKVEQACDSLTNMCCDSTTSSVSDNVPGLPFETTMSHTSGGIYSGSFTISGGAGTVFVSALVTGEGGIYGEYINVRDPTVDPEICQTDAKIDFDWGTGNATPLSVGNNFCVRWSGYISPPTSETYTITFSTEGIGGYGVLDTVNLVENVGLQMYLELGTLYSLEHVYTEGTNNPAGSNLKWSSPSIVQQVIPASAYNSQMRIGLYEMEILPTSVPAKSEVVNGPPSVIIEDTYTVTMQSKNIAEVAHDVDSDTYLVVFSDGASQTFTETAIHQGSGLYSASFTPTLIGTYTVTINLTNDYTATDPSIQTQISGSGYTVIVYPGPVVVSKCYYNNKITSIPEQVAGVSYDFIVQYVDRYNNLHYQTMSDEIANGMQQIVTAEYNNHDDWPSPIGVEDDPDWQTTYGLDPTATGIDQNDGTTQATLTVQRAGDYQLTVQVDSLDMQNSPYAYYKVRPAGIHAPACVAVDVVPDIQAGFKLVFSVQGRDEFQNNIADLLEDAVDTDYSFTSVSLADSSVVYEGIVTDITEEDMPGVYVAELDFPLTTEPGRFNLNLMLGGLQVPTPTLKVEACTNANAYDSELVTKDGNLVTLETLEYTIGEEEQTIELPLVKIYCLMEPILVFESARRLTSNRQEVLTEEQLAEYGLTLQLSGFNPSLQVFSETQQADDATFELRMSATVVEEPSWSDTVLAIVKVYAQPQVYVHQMVLAEDAPKLDFDSVTIKTLTMMENEMEVQFLSPVILDCVTEQWSKVLPDIEGENEESKFDVSVDLDQASKFLTYSPSKREFGFEPPKGAAQKQFYTVTVSISDPNDKTSQYSLRVSYQCEGEETGESEAWQEADFEFRYDENPPTPYIYNVDSYGEVRIRFNQTMDPGAALRETEFRQNRRVLSRTDDANSDDDELVEISGRATETFQNFSMIHNHTFTTAEGLTFPSVKFAVQADDPDSKCAKLLQFNWECVGFSSEEMIFRLQFVNPECVSSSSGGGDLLVVTFYDQRLFQDTDGKLVWPQTEISKRLTRQMAASGAEKEALEAIASSASTAIVASSLINVILNFFLTGSMSALVGALKNLQIIVHVMLIQVLLAAHAQVFIRELQKLIAFEVYDTSEIAQATLQAEASEAVDIHFESVGYETSDAIINSGPIAFIIFMAPFMILFIFLLSRYCCWAKGKTYFKEQLQKTFFNRILIFIDGSFLILGVCCAVNIYQVYNGVANKNFSYYFAICVTFSINPYLLCLLGYLCRKFPELKEEKMKKRIGQAYQDYDLKRAGRPVLVYMVLSYTRRVALCFVITFGRSSIVAQLFFTNFCSILVISFIGIVRPLNSTIGNRLELANEYTILLLYCHCITQTDFVEDPAGRSAMGWSLIALISLNIAMNFGVMIARDLYVAYRKLKIYILKRRYFSRVREEQERRARIYLYRQIAIKDIRQQQNVKSLQDKTSKKSSTQKKQETQLVPFKSKDWTLLGNNCQIQGLGTAYQTPLKIRAESSQQTGTERKGVPDMNFLKVQVMTPQEIDKFKDNEDGFKLYKIKQRLIADQSATLQANYFWRNANASHMTSKTNLLPPTSPGGLSGNNSLSLRPTRPTLGDQLIPATIAPTVTREMLQKLLDEEQEILDSNLSYMGGGNNPPYGPAMQTDDDIDILMMDFWTIRTRYSKKLQEAIDRLPV